MDYEIDRDDGPSGQPSLTNMTSVAIKILSKNKHKGFFLVVHIIDTLLPYTGNIPKIQH